MSKSKTLPNQRVFFRTKLRWPSVVVFLEPSLQWEPIDSEKWTVTADQWCYCVVCDNDVEDADFGECDDGGAILALCEELLEESKSVVLIMHGVENMIGLLDFSNVFSLVGFKASAYFVGRERAYIEVNRDDQRVVLCDIRNWLPGDLDRLGAWGGYSYSAPPRWWPDEDYKGRYAGHGIFALVSAWQKWIEWNEENNLGGFAYSMSSLAYNWWTRTEGAKNCRHPRKQAVADKEREAFYGGFCYVHKIGYFEGDGYYLLDCNGLYGHILRDMMLPYRHVTTRRIRKETDLSNALKRGGVMAYGVFSLESGYLPVRRGRLIDWQQDRVECWLCQPELLWLMEYGTIHQLKELIVYDMKPLGKEIGEYALQQRFLTQERGERYENKLWKLFINNFFGKLAQRFGTIEVTDAEEGDVDGVIKCISAKTGKIYNVTVFCGSRIIEIDDGGSSYFVPSVSAFVTSYGRVRLWQLCHRAGWENVYYNDTDSLIVNRTGYLALRDQIADNVPGMLSLDQRDCTLEIRGKKQYRIGEKRADNTHPGHFRSCGDGVIEWIERDNHSGQKRDCQNSLVVRKNFRRAWDAKQAELDEILKDVSF